LGNQRLRQFFLVALGVTYMGMGIFIYRSDVIPVKPWGTVLAILFVAYGAWRAYRGLTLKP